MVRPEDQESASPWEKDEEIKIEFRLTTLKPLHTKWLVEYYNEITSENGSFTIINSWKAAGIYDAIKAGTCGLQSIEPFKDISPLVTEHVESESFLPATIDQLTDELRESFVNVLCNEENSEWEQSGNEDDVYQTYDTYIPVVFVSVFCSFVFQVRRFSIVLVLHF